MKSVAITLKVLNTSISLTEKVKLEIKKIKLNIERVKLKIEKKKITMKKKKIIIEKIKLNIENTKLAVQLMKQSLKHWVPPNIKFYVDDVEKDWTYGPDEAFDVIHARQMGGSISD
ncbi:TAM domain methyltransferase [Blastomyces dermatitidis ER-3]|uniref:TAM domain methyltransferase n=1 Tax=Ajellomyces dermatitidis (strain ER-3 / ATCC MYA-2586) TaxID=559297 RepID=A0ABP2F7T1_AJEDR|nr:TAM domain methyltransferase [Blastomyces dermatitidis ER-3]EEQ92431.2 TAM domain methyltransferase [Blastomyces dermatitidis ER-3]